MATEAIKSSIITAKHGAVPTTLFDNGVENGVLKQATAVVTVTDSKDLGSTYRLAEIPTSARGVSVLMVAATVVTATGDIGLYYAPGVSSTDIGTVLDADFFGSEVACAGAKNLDVTHESGVYTPTGTTQPLWQAAGLSADPGGMFEVVFTATAGIGTTGTLSCKVQYTI